jgi:hypothetical protein
VRWRKRDCVRWQFRPFCVPFCAGQRSYWRALWLRLRSVLPRLDLRQDIANGRCYPQGNLLRSTMYRLSAPDLPNDRTSNSSHFSHTHTLRILRRTAAHILKNWLSSNITEPRSKRSRSASMSPVQWRLCRTAVLTNDSCLELVTSAHVLRVKSSV